MYGSSIVGAKFDQREHRLTGELVFGTRGEEQWVRLTMEKVGPLKPFVLGSRKVRSGLHTPEHKPIKNGKP